MASWASLSTSAARSSGYSAEVGKGATRHTFSPRLLLLLLSLAAKAAGQDLRYTLWTFYNDASCSGTVVGEKFSVYGLCRSSDTQRWRLDIISSAPGDASKLTVTSTAFSDAECRVRDYYFPTSTKSFSSRACNAQPLDPENIMPGAFFLSSAILATKPSALAVPKPDYSSYTYLNLASCEAARIQTSRGMQTAVEAEALAVSKCAVIPPITIESSSSSSSSRSSSSSSTTINSFVFACSTTALVTFSFSDKACTNAAMASNMTFACVQKGSSSMFSFGQCGAATITKQAECVKCNAGTSSPDGSGCQPCAHGTYSSVSGATACESCPSGKSTASSGAASIGDCAPPPPPPPPSPSQGGGYPSGDGGGGWSPTPPTPPSPLSPPSPPRAPLSCPLGQKVTLDWPTFTERCAPCPVSSFGSTNADGESVCIACPEGTTTAGSGVSGWTECSLLACGPGYGPPTPKVESETFLGLPLKTIYYIAGGAGGALLLVILYCFCQTKKSPSGRGSRGGGGSHGPSHSSQWATRPSRDGPYSTSRGPQYPGRPSEQHWAAHVAVNPLARSSGRRRDSRDFPSAAAPGMYAEHYYPQEQQHQYHLEQELRQYPSSPPARDAASHHYREDPYPQAHTDRRVQY